MSRHETELDPVIARELDELEALFADDLHAVRPRMEPAFQATMDARVDEWRLKPARGRRLWFAPAAGGAAAALMALSVATGGQSASQDSGASGGAVSSQAGTAQDESASGGSTAATKSLATP